MHGRQWPLKGQYYDNLFLHYRPRGDWYEDDQVPRPLLTLERVLASQRGHSPTDWTRAWESFQTTQDNRRIQGERGVRLGRDPLEEVQPLTKWQHIS